MVAIGIYPYKIGIYILTLQRKMISHGKSFFNFKPFPPSTPFALSLKMPGWLKYYKHDHNATNHPVRCEDRREMKNGKLHSTNGHPAVVEYDREYFSEGEDEGYGYTISNDKLREWYFEGKLHREQSSRAGEDGPARVKYEIIDCKGYKHSSKVLEEWYRHGELYREGDYPARIIYKELTDNGTCESCVDLETSKEEHGIKKIEEYYANGKLHRESGPAVIRYYTDGDVKSEEWYIEGDLRRETEYYDDDDYKGFHDTWYKYGEKHRDDGPAYTSETKLYTERFSYVNDVKEWYQYGKLHRIDGPARIDRSFDVDFEKSTTEEWYVNGKLHREDGPAYISSSESSTEKKWYIQGELHREQSSRAGEDGPAIVYSRGSYLKESYYRHGLEVNKT